MMVSGRYMFINVWRNIADTPVKDMPLGLCDAQSFGSEELITFELRYADRVGEVYYAAHRDSHRWLYYPDMVKDEALLLKVWDSHGAIATVGSQHSGDDRYSLSARNGNLHYCLIRFVF